ncbi:Probable E3 ubiquitin-protein ligase LUL4 [Linum grandiflorum]
MGISWSSSRRRQNHPYYHQQHPPHLPPPPPPHYFSTEQTLLPSPPPPPPPPQPNQGYYAAAPTTTAAPPSTAVSQPSYAAPPQPPIHSYYNSHPYNSCGYSNQMAGRFNYQPYYYGNSSGGWPPGPHAVRPNVGPSVQPVPYVEHQNAKKVRNEVNVHKDTLKLELDENNPDHHLLSFVFDALVDGSISISYFAKEEPNCKFVPAYPDVHMPVRIPFQKGVAQKFLQPSGTGIDLGFFELDDLSKPSVDEDVFPLVIVAETCSPVNATGELDDSLSGPASSGNMQITQAVLEKKDGGPFSVKVIKQILWIEGVRYELREIYGMGSSSAEDFDDTEPGKECVICMTEPKDTAVLPCRHMCMCSECAKELRIQSNKCPICRQPIEELIEIKVKSGGDQ